jgi:hypothetical protein
MHTFIYPNKNTYITDESGYEDGNFGLDSTLEIKSVNTFIPVAHLYATQSISSSIVCDSTLYNFNGYINGKINGAAELTTAFFRGTGSFNTSDFTGTISSASYTNFSGSLIGSGSGVFNGTFSGSIYSTPTNTSFISGTFLHFTGSVSSGSILVGTSSFYSPYVTYDINSTVSRTLMSFDLTEVSKSIASGDITGSVKYEISLRNAQAKELPLNYTIYAYPLTRDWVSGDGRYQLGGSTYGASWNYTDYYNGTAWTNFGGDYITSSLYVSSQSFAHTNSDIKMDVTKIVNGWLSGSIQNYGIILLTSLETASFASNNVLRFFGTETNTIYSPYLDVSWDDSVYITGSMLPVSHPYGIVIQDLKKTYKFGSIARIDVFARARNPLKNFTKGIQANYYLTSSYLPQESYYMIKDNESEEVIVDFSDCTKLSCDGYVNYFLFDTTAFPQERYYKVLIKTINSDGEVIIFDHGNIFKVTR